MVQRIPEHGFQVTSLPITLDGERPKVRFASPKLGEHTDEILNSVASAAKAAE